MRTTIKDIARAAGVSPTTVSFVLNNKPVSISQETRNKVIKAVEELNYRPNQLAVSLVTNTTNTIGLILPDSANPFFAALSNQIERQLRKYDITVINGNTDGDPVLTRKYLDLFTDRRVDGIILAQMDFEDPREAAKCQMLISSAELPIVYVDRTSEGTGYCTVMVDQELVGYLATKHLLDIGHTRIGCASGSIRLKVNADRYKGYLAALAARGYHADPELLFCGTLSIECGRTALPFLLGQGVTAVFAFNDMIAYGLYKECFSYGLSIPDDLSVIGVDDIPFSDIIQPPLTTIAQPVTQIADAAVNGIINLIKNPDGPRTMTTLPPLLKVRASTAKR